MGLSSMPGIIMVLDNGQIVEQGHHDKLIACGGRYAQLWEVQTKDYGVSQ